jgi:hypothetical protein
MGMRTLSSFINRFLSLSTSSRSTARHQHHFLSPSGAHTRALALSGYAQFEPEAMLSRIADGWFPILAACV